MYSRRQKCRLSFTLLRHDRKSRGDIACVIGFMFASLCLASMLTWFMSVGVPTGGKSDKIGNGVMVVGYLIAITALESFATISFWRLKQRLQTYIISLEEVLRMETKRKPLGQPQAAQKASTMAKGKLTVAIALAIYALVAIIMQIVGGPFAELYALSLPVRLGVNFGFVCIYAASVIISVNYRCRHVRMPDRDRHALTDIDPLEA